MISDNDPLVTRFISIPRDLSNLNCEAFLAGIAEACLRAAQFPATVTAHSTGSEIFPNRVTLLIKLDANSKT